MNGGGTAWLLLMFAIGLVVVCVAVVLMVLAERKPVVFVWTANAAFADDAGHPIQWEVRTPAGSAVVTKVMTGRGQSMEIETMFYGQRGPSLYYVAPARKVAERRLGELVDAHLAGNPLLSEVSTGDEW